MTRTGDTALDALAERVCTAAGTDLDAVLADLRDGRRDPATPTALRAGWHAPDLPITRTSEETP